MNEDEILQRVENEISKDINLEIFREIKAEMFYQNGKYENNDKKSFEVWLLLASEIMKDATERYAHSTQDAALTKLLKAVTCGIRALQKKHEK